jgi:hypothetical protein
VSNPVSTKADLEGVKRLIENQTQYFSDVIADRDCNFGLNPSWVRLYPYQLLAKAGATHNLELRLRNYRQGPMQLEATLILPDGWRGIPEKVSVSAPANGWGTGYFKLTIPGNWDRSNPRVAIAADIVTDGQYLGQIAEGIVDIELGA